MTTLIAPDLAVATRATSASRLSTLAQLLADPWRALSAAVFALVAVVGLDALGDPDVWWHLQLGEWILAHHRVPTIELFSYTAQGHPMLAHEWLSDTVFALLARAGGLFLVALVMGAVAWSAMLAVALRGRARGAGPLALALGLALGAKAAQPVLGARPQVFTVALVCWTLWIAETYLRDGGRRRWLLPPLFLLWANLHAGFLAGLGILTLLLAVETVRRRVQPRAAITVDRLRGLAIAIGASALAACVNPAGPLLYRFAITTTATEGQKSIIEWQSPNFHDPGMWALLFLLVTLAALPALGGRLDVRDAVLAAAGTAMALLAVRNTAVCVALVTPAWMAMAGHAGRRLAARKRVPLRTRVRAGPVIVGGAVIGAALTALAYTGVRTHAAASSVGVAAAYPSCATSALMRAPTTQHVFTTYGTGGFVIDRLWPHASVYEYGESISLGTIVFADYQRIAAGAQTSPTAMQLLDASRTTAVLFPKSDLTAELDAAPGWSRVLDDHGMLLYVRGDASWAAGAACSSAAARSG